MFHLVRNLGRVVNRGYMQTDVIVLDNAKASFRIKEPSYTWILRDKRIYTSVDLLSERDLSPSSGV